VRVVMYICPLLHVLISISNKLVVRLLLLHYSDACGDVLSVIAPTAAVVAPSVAVPVTDKAQSWAYPVVVDTTTVSSGSSSTHIQYGSVMTLMMTQVPAALSNKYTTTSKVSCATISLLVQHIMCSKYMIKTVVVDVIALVYTG
jgi:hypothetical protein